MAEGAALLVDHVLPAVGNRQWVLSFGGPMAQRLGYDEALRSTAPYSPEFNPIEGVWKTTKKITTHNRFFRTTTERDAALTATFGRFNAKPASIAGHVARFL